MSNVCTVFKNIKQYIFTQYLRTRNEVRDSSSLSLAVAIRTPGVLNGKSVLNNLSIAHV